MGAEGATVAGAPFMHIDATISRTTSPRGTTMKNLLVDERDQRFVLHEMLGIDELCRTPLYGHLAKEDIDAALASASELALRESYPIMVEADREGCRLENGIARVPRCFHRLKAHYDQGGWPSSYIPREHGGLGFPMFLWAATFEHFVHNFGFLWPWASPLSLANGILQFGSEEQKRRYLPNLVSGRWGSCGALTEDQAGADDLGRVRTTAARQPDGSYRIKGTKPTITNGDSDLFENILAFVLARVEGDPANVSGLSLFLVPKYLVNPDGSLGRRNDYSVVAVERKLGLRASPTVSINFGENGDCYGELLGARGEAVGMFISLLRSCPFYGVISTGFASAAYLHALDHARNRVQGAHISEAGNADARSVALVAHPFVRRRLLSMKAQVEGMRALVSYCCLCYDRAKSSSDPAEKQRWSGLNDVLFSVQRHYTAERAAQVAETAVKMHGRHGFYDGFPVHQFMRDLVPIGWWEGDASGNILFYLTQLLLQRDGLDFTNLLTEMGRTIERYREVEELKDLARDLGKRVELLREVGGRVAACFKEGRAIVPICNGMPLVHFMGDICVGWLLFWQAGIAAGRLGAILQENRIDARDAAGRNAFLVENADAAFYDGKVHTARFFIRNVLPAVDGVATSLGNEDLSAMAIHERSF
jgi:alkylation response protein AidB-like acyl-CoA dehydrogenase